MARDDPYSVLGITPGSRQGEVERAYRRLAASRPPLDPVRRAAVEHAYAVLSQPQRRETLDRDLGHKIHPAFAAGSQTRGDALFRAARLAIRAGELERAARLLERAVACRPWEAAYRGLLGLTLARLGRQTHRAGVLCRQAVMMEPHDPRHRLVLARFYQSMGFRLRARRLLEGLPATDKDDEFPCHL